MKITFPTVGGFATENASEKDTTVKIGFKINCKDNILDIKQKLITTFLDEYVYPSVFLRAKQNKLAQEFKLFKAHIIMSEDPDKTEILLNDNVRFFGIVKLTNKTRNRGDPILVGDIEDVLGIYPSEKNDPNAAHIMLLKLMSNWLISIDLFYNKEKNRYKMENAKSFLKAANICLREKLYGPFIDNLYSSTELGIQSILFQRPMRNFLPKSQLHYKTSKLFEDYSKLGNLEVRYWENYKKLRELRLRGRYLRGVKKIFNLDLPTSNDLVKTTTEFLEFVESSLKKSDKSNIPSGEMVAFGASGL